MSGAPCEEFCGAQTPRIPWHGATPQIFYVRRLSRARRASVALFAIFCRWKTTEPAGHSSAYSIIFRYSPPTPRGTMFYCNSASIIQLVYTVFTPFPTSSYFLRLFHNILTNYPWYNFVPYVYSTIFDLIILHLLIVYNHPTIFHNSCTLFQALVG